MNEVEKNREFPLGPEYLEMDPENYDGAAEELEVAWRQPTSMVGKERRRRIEVHQILRIRAEDLHLREEEHHIGELGNFMLFTRPMLLPPSPLSAKSPYSSPAPINTV